jgi:hypothetical protein
VTCKVNLSLNLSSNIALCLGFFFLILCMKDRSGDREEKLKMRRENTMCVVNCDALIYMRAILIMSFHLF